MIDLTRDWQRAIQHELDYREITEFRLVNSTSAQKVARLLKGVKLTTDEFRVLCGWQRDFDGQHRPDNRFAGRAEHRARLEDSLDYYFQVRALLGDARFAIYLIRLETDFERIDQALASIEGVSPAIELDLWWMKQRREIAQTRPFDPAEWKRINERTRIAAESLLGEKRFAQYSADETAGWLR